MRKFRGNRALLNLPGHESTAAIVAEVEDTREWLPGKDGNGKAVQRKYDCEPQVKFQIANCDRSILLNCYVGNKDCHDNNIHKLDTLINSLTEFKLALIDEQIRYEDRIDALEKKKKANAKKKREAK